MVAFFENATIEYSSEYCVCVCVCVCVRVMSDQGQGHCNPSKISLIYHNTNCQVLQLNFGTSSEAYVKHVCSTNNNTQYFLVLSCVNSISELWMT